MLLIGSHVSFKKDTQLLGSLEEALSYGSNCFMFYTGAPQNTSRVPINDALTYKALELMKEKNIDVNNIIVHAPYIINLANKSDLSKYNFAISFLTEECKRCEELFMNKLVLHPGSHVGCGIQEGIENIANALNLVLKNTDTTILLETMAGKGTEVGSKLDEIEEIISRLEKKEQIGICLDTCHLSDSGLDIGDFNKTLDILEEKKLLSKVLCVHVNDSKNIIGSHKDRHENIGYGTIGFDNLINVIYNPRLENVPKILETPWIENYPPYKFEIQMIKNKEFNPNLVSDLKEYYK